MGCNAYLPEDLPSQGHQQGEDGQQRETTLLYLRGRKPDGPTLFGKLLFFGRRQIGMHYRPFLSICYRLFGQSKQETHETVENKEPPRNREQETEKRNREMADRLTSFVKRSVDPRVLPPKGGTDPGPPHSVACAIEVPVSRSITRSWQG